MNYFEKEIMPKHKRKIDALKDYLRKIVIYQSTNKKNNNWNEKRRSTLNMTYRQIKEKTGLSLGLISKAINEMKDDGLIKEAHREKTKYRNDMVFFYFTDIFEALISRNAYKIIKKMNTRNIFIKYKILKTQLLKKQLKDFYTQWDFEKERWVREVRSNFTLTKDEKDNLFSSMWAVLNA